MSKVIDWMSRIHDVGRRWRLFLGVGNRRHRSVVSRCGIGRRRGILRGNGDVAAQRDAVVGVLVSGEQSICWRRWRVVQGDHVACDGGRIDSCRVVQIRPLRHWPAQRSRMPEPRSVRQSRWRAREGCRLVRRLDYRCWYPALAESDASVVGSLGAAAVEVSTGSIVSTTGAALARASLATLPVSAGSDASLVGSLGAAAVGVSTGSIASTTGAALARASLATFPVSTTGAAVAAGVVRQAAKRAHGCRSRS